MSFIAISVASLVFFVFACTMAQGQSRTMQQAPVLRYSLQAKDFYVIGNPVGVEFTLKNLTSRTLSVLTWYTPLEGLKGDIFKVTRDGVELRYEGRMVKRADPNANDYVRISAHASVSSTIDLSSAYDFSVPGHYNVEFAGQIFDVVSEDNSVPRPMSAHQGIEIQGNGVRFRMEKK